jgi:type I restriction enzyme M protein
VGWHRGRYVGASRGGAWFPSSAPGDELLQRDEAHLDIFWLRDESLESADHLPPPDVLAAEIADDLEAALEQFRAIAEDLAKPVE